MARKVKQSEKDKFRLISVKQKESDDDGVKVQSVTLIVNDRDCNDKWGIQGIQIIC